MSGGKGNIKPEDGKQFSSEYQPQEKWTEDKALKVGYDLIEWLNLEDENVFFEEFLYLNNDYHEKLISYLYNKYTSFLTLIERAKKIQEVKLKKFGCFDKLNATMTKFTLVNNHGWKDKSEQENTNIDYDIANISKEKMQEIKKNLDDKI